MWRKPLWFLVVLCMSALVLSRESPHADLVRQLLKNQSYSRFSNDVFEDAILDVPGLIAKYRYPIEVHNPITSDGYILEVHRIPHGRDANNVPSDKKPVALLMHGIFSSSADFVIMGPGSALAYLLAEEGYDVWMGNARGTYYSRRHVSLDPDTPRRNDYWRFSWDEIGRIDLPTIIDYALEVTGQSKLHYVGHSQGTTVFFVMGSLRPDYNQKIISMQALAPVAYLAYNENPLFLAISPYAYRIEALASLIGIGDFLPRRELYTWLGRKYCNDESQLQPLCSNMLFIAGGANPAQHNATMIPAILGHSPAGASVRQLAHYAQSIVGKEFRRYDFGNSLSNLDAYGSITPPYYNLSQITTQVFLHYSDFDMYSHVRDVNRLFNELSNPEAHRVSDPLFSHIDFLWAIDAKQLLYDNVIRLMKARDEEEETLWPDVTLPPSNNGSVTHMLLKKIYIIIMFSILRVYFWNT